jgi:hypothetical protein
VAKAADFVDGGGAGRLARISAGLKTILLSEKR